MTLTQCIHTHTHTLASHISLRIKVDTHGDESCSFSQCQRKQVNVTVDVKSSWRSVLNTHYDNSQWRWLVLVCLMIFLTLLCRLCRQIPSSRFAFVQLLYRSGFSKGMRRSNIQHRYWSEIVRKSLDWISEKGKLSRKCLNYSRRAMKRAACVTWRAGMGRSDVTAANP